jgi:2-polyprenyl-3-methyl-5-hydroxy-6-metoxy-1,4-benzoquinol methylase
MNTLNQATIEDFNRQQWTANHRGFKYFGEHPDYGRPASCESLKDDTSFYNSIIRDRYAIDPTGKVVCEIGIGYGRLSANFKMARHIYGIDVSQELFQTTAKYLELKGIGQNTFTLLLSDDYQQSISSKGDFVFSSIVFQHIPKSFQMDYLRFFANWLNPGGEMLIQFLVGEMSDIPLGDQPSFFWKVTELFEVVSNLPLTLKHFDLELVVPGPQPCYWAWAYWTRPE